MCGCGTVWRHPSKVCPKQKPSANDRPVASPITSGATRWPIPLLCLRQKRAEISHRTSAGIAECYATGTAEDGVASSCHQQTAAVDRSWNAFAMVLEPNHRRFPKSDTFPRVLKSVSVLLRRTSGSYCDKSFEIRN